MTDTIPDVPALLALPLTDRTAYTLADGRVYIYDAAGSQKDTDEFYAFPTPRIVGGTVIPVDAGGVLRLVRDPAILRPEWYGEPADFDNNAPGTTRVLVHILDLLGGRTLRLLARTYDIAGGLFYEGTGAIEGEGTNLNDQTRLRLVEPAEYVLKMRGQGNRLCNLTVDANRLAEYAIQEASAPYAERRGVKATGATRDGVRLLRNKNGPNLPLPPPPDPTLPNPDATNNDGQQWERCAFWYNGTAYLSMSPLADPPVSSFTRLPAEIDDRQRMGVPGTATITANRSDVGGAGTAWFALGIQPGDAVWIQGVKPALDFVGEVAEVVSDTEIRLRDGHVPNAQQTMSGRPFAILRGCGWRDERHNDNNICQLNYPFARANAHAGVYLEGLYGHALINGQYDYNGVYGIQVGGRRDDSALPVPYQDPVFSAEITRPYLEGNGYRAAALFYAVGFTVTTPLWSRTEEDEDPYVLGGPDEAIGVILSDRHTLGGFRAITAIGRQAP